MKTIFFIILLLLILSACSSNADQIATIKAGTLKGPSSVGLIKLIDETSLTKNHLKIRVFNNPVHMRPALLQNKLQFAVIPAAMAALLYNKGVKYRIAAVTGWGNLYIVGKKKITSPAELKGNTLHMVGKGMTPEAVLRYILKKNKIDKKEINFSWKFPNPADLGAASAAGLVDFALLPEPFASLACRKNSNLLISFNLASAVKASIPQTVLVVRNDISVNSPVLKEFMTKCSLSSQWVNNNPAKAAPLIIKHKIVPLITRESIVRCNIRFVVAENAEKELFSFFRLLYTFNPLLTGGRIPDEEILLR